MLHIIHNVIAGVTACAAFAGPVMLAQQPAHPAAESTLQGQPSTEQQIEHDLYRALKFAGVESSGLRVNVKNGTATITGTVNGIGERNRAVDAIRAMQGVRNVTVAVTVEPESRPDHQIRQDVLNALAFDPATAEADIDVAVEDAIITLSGTARGWALKELVAALVEDIPGVRDIRNEIAVAAPARPDAEIREAIKRRFRRNPSVSDHIKVQVEDGEVNLSGVVRSALEKNWALADARTLGVRRIDAGKLVVDPTLDRSTIATPTRLSDDQIKRGIMDAFLADPRVYSFNPRVEVADGTVTLHGSVSNLKARQVAVQLARNCAGVKEVIDKLRVQPVSRPDPQIERDIVGAFDRSLLIRGDDVSVDVENGRVRLTGTVDSSIEKSAAVDIVARTRGIVEVEDKLTVAGR